VRNTSFRAAWVCAITVIGVARPTASAQTIALAPCRVPNVDGEIKCGTYTVRENPADPSSRVIPLKVMVLPSRSPTPAPDPVFFVSPGGPGTTNSEGFVVGAWL
jgi:hypothetical protein